MVYYTTEYPAVVAGFLVASVLHMGEEYSAYVPLSVYAYHFVISSGELTLRGVMVTGLLGLLYQAVPLTYFALASALQRS
jgi:hypothetical protein